MIKTQFFLLKNNKNAKKVYVSIKQHFYYEHATLTRDITCSKLQRYGKNIGDKRLSVEHTPDEKEVARS